MTILYRCKLPQRENSWTLKKKKKACTQPGTENSSQPRIKPSGTGDGVLLPWTQRNSQRICRIKKKKKRCRTPGNNHTLFLVSYRSSSVNTYPRRPHPWNLGEWLTRGCLLVLLKRRLFSDVWRPRADGVWGVRQGARDQPHFGLSRPFTEGFTIRRTALHCSSSLALRPRVRHSHFSPVAWGPSPKRT